VKRFISCRGIRARGILTLREVFPNVIFLAAEIISKSINIRGTYRYLFLYPQNVLLAEHRDEEGEKLLYQYIAPTFQTSDLSEIKINAMRIRKLAKNGIEMPIKLTMLVNYQTAGVEGLETVTLTGENIIRGIQTLKDRQEVDLKAEAIGPWIEIETNSLKLEMSKGVKIKKFSSESLGILYEKVLV
jgi:hypothetical protein